MMKAQPSIYTLDHIYFAYLDAARRAELNDRIKRGVSHIVSFHDESGGLVFFGVIDTDCVDRLHLSECAGMFPKHYRYLDAFMAAMARASGKAKISFASKIDGVKYLGKRLGFSLDHCGDFVRDAA